MLSIEDRTPDNASVRGFPDSAVDGAEIKGGRISGNSSYGDGASTAEWTEQSPLQSTKEVRANILADRWDKSRETEQENETLT